MSEFARSLAIVIGINNYQNSISPLQNAVNDATKLKQILEQKHQYDRVWQLLDDRATLKILKNFLENVLPQHVQPDDRLIFYFAGHGIALNGENGPTGYLIPQDAILGDPQTYLPMTELQAYLEKLTCRHFLGILDCCFAGAFRWSSTRDLRSVPEVIHQERYDRFIADPAWQVIASTAADQTALDAFAINTERGTAGEHSPFAAALIAALEGQADTHPSAANGQLLRDGVITATELYLYLRDRIESTDVGNRLRQTPGIWPLNKHDKGEYIFLVPGHALNLPPAPPLDKSQNPYRGLESFEAKDSALFFGRTDSIVRLGEFVSSHPLTVVLGASGSGKSSLVKAGLVPYLEQLTANSDRQWQILAPFRPGASPLQALNNALVRAKLAAVSITQLGIEEKVAALSSHLAAWSQQYPDSKLLLVIDQFEELMTLCQDDREREQFLWLLAQAVAQYPQLRLVLTLRSDFEPQFRDTALKEYWHVSRFIVSPMTRADLRAVIEKPAQTRVMYFEPSELVERLIDEVADMPGALPLLSFALSELYLKYLNRQREAQNGGSTINRSLTQADYDAVGGVIRSLTQRADEEYQALVTENSAYAQIIRQVMLRMVALGGDELARRQVPLSELEYPPPKNGLVTAVIERFTKARLLVTGEDAEGNYYVEPAHDALVRGWQRLLEWKQEEAESLLLQRRLTPAAQEWKNLNRQERRLGFPATENVIDWLDRQLYTVENFCTAQWVRLWRRTRNRQQIVGGASPLENREHPRQFLWDANPYLTVLEREFNANDSWLSQVEAEFVRQSVWQKRRNKSWRWRIAFGVILGLGGLTVWALANLRQSTISQMLTNSESASGNLRSDRLILDASIDSLSAGDSLKNNLLLTVFPPKADEKSQVIKTLRKAVYTVREYNRQEGFPSGVQSIFWKKDRLLVVSAENDGTVRVLDKQTKKLAELAGDRSKITRVIFSPNGSQLAIGTNNGQILLWDWQNQQRGTVLQSDRCKETKNISSANSCAITSLSFDRHGSKMVSVGANGIARQWNLSNHQYQDLQVPHHKIITAGFHANGQLLLVTKTPDGKTLSVFNSSFQQLSKTQQFPASVDIAILSPQGEEIVITYGSGNTVGSQGYLWHWRNQNNSQGDKLSVRPDNISFSPDGRQLATTAFNNGTIRLLNLKTNNITELKGHRGQIANLNFRSNGRVLATVSADGTLRLWALTQQQLGQSQELPDKVNSLTFSRDGQQIATQALDGTVRLLDLSGKLVQQFHNPYPVFKSLSFSPDNKQLATLSNKGTVGILDLSSQHYREFTGKYNSSNLSFSPDGQQLAVTGNDNRSKKVYVLNVSSGQPDDKPFPYQETIRINNVIWKSDNKILLAGVQQLSRASKSIVLVDVESGTQLQTITEHLSVGDFSGIGANSDGSLAAFVQEDGSVSLWYLDGTKMGEVRDPDRKINSVILSPDSSMLATIGEDGTTKLWEIGKLDKLLAKSCDRVRDYLSNNHNVEERNRHLCDNVPKLTEKISATNR